MAKDGPIRLGVNLSKDSAEALRRLAEGQGMSISDVVRNALATDPRRDKLLELLRSLAGSGDPETAHSMADDALLEYISDPEVSDAFNAIDKWYA